MTEQDSSIEQDSSTERKGVFSSLGSRYTAGCTALALGASALIPASAYALDATITDKMTLAGQDAEVVAAAALVIIAGLIGFGLILKMMGLLR